MDSALAGIITALVSGLCVAIPTIVATITSNKAHDKVIDERMKYMSEQIVQLSQKVEKHNEFNDRLIIVEQSVKSAHKRLDDLKAKEDLANG
jgi:uncharacterized protein YtpQ (UPF0354 family)